MYRRIQSRVVSFPRMGGMGVRALSVSSSSHIAIVGSGPSGFYTAKYLLEKNPDVKVDLIEALPMPGGLVNFGIAPDHPEVKSVMDTFTKVAKEKNSRFRFFGNVELQRSNVYDQYQSTHTSSDNSVSIESLTSAYKAVVLACGAQADRELHVPNEDAKGVVSARAFVNWYNGHPDYVRDYYYYCYYCYTNCIPVTAFVLTLSTPHTTHTTHRYISASK